MNLSDAISKSGMASRKEQGLRGRKELLRGTGRKQIPPLRCEMTNKKWGRKQQQIPLYVFF